MDIHFHTALPGDWAEAARIEAACFPPNEACTPERMHQRVEIAPEHFLIAQCDGKTVGFLTGLAADEDTLRDEFFTNASLHNPRGRNILLLSLAVLPEYQGKGIATALMAEYVRLHEDRDALILTCLPGKVGLYQKMGFRDLGPSQSQWGGDRWHEMRRERGYEIFDIVDEGGRPTGQTAERTTAHAQGYRHRTAHIWVVRPGKMGPEILLQKRADNKDSFPGCFDTSSAGHIQAGDEPITSALRELHEELGIAAREEDLCYIGQFPIAYEKEFYGKLFRDSEVPFVFLYGKPVTLSDLTLQEEEISDAAWFSLAETLEAVTRHDPKFCVPRDSLLLLKGYLQAHPL